MTAARRLVLVPAALLLAVAVLLGLAGAAHGPTAQRAAAQDASVDTTAPPALSDTTAAPAPQGTPTASPSPTKPSRLTTGRGAPLRVRYAAGAARRHTYLAWLPPGTTKRRAVVLIHGGAWVRGRAESMARYAQRLYDRGIPAFSLEYRLADRDRSGTAWGAQGHDVRAAVAHVKRNAGRYGISAYRVSAMGSSAGGHLATALGSDGVGRRTVRAVAAFSPPVDMYQVWKDRTTGPAAYLLAGRVRSDLLQCPATGGSAACRSRWSSASQPSTASRGDAPTLLFYQRDEFVSTAHGAIYRRAYRRAAGHVDVRLDIQPGDQHAVEYALDTQEGVRERVWKRALAFVLANS
ncbi:MAG: alpha/beta hydrolase [Actinomycetes bacterium]